MRHHFLGKAGERALTGGVGKGDTVLAFSSKCSHPHGGDGGEGMRGNCLPLVLPDNNYLKTDW